MSFTAAMRRKGLAMIEGLKLIVPGSDLIELCKSEAAKKLASADNIQKILDTVGTEVAAGNVNSNTTVNDNGKERMKSMRGEAAELLFHSKYIVADEKYLLERQDLHRLGVVKSAY